MKDSVVIQILSSKTGLTDLQSPGNDTTGVFGWFYILSEEATSYESHKWQSQ